MKKVLSILLVEDNMIEIMKIRRTITLLDLHHKVIEAKNAEKALSLLESKAVFPDIILLDLNMPKISGIDFLSILKKNSNYCYIPVIILTTSDPKFAIEAFEYNFIVDYLLKPIELPRFQKAIAKLRSQLQPSIPSTSTAEIKNDFYVNIDRRLIKIDLHSIYLIEANGDYINIRTEDNNYIVHSTLKKIEEKLPGSLFLKIHRSYIINVKKIIDIEDNSVLIKKDIVPVSRSKKSELMQRLDLL